MATNTTSTITLNNNWTQSSTDATNINNTITDEGQITYSRTYVTGSSGINELFHNLETLGSGSGVSYDLSNLTQSFLDYTVNKSFSKIKSFHIKNSSTVSGYDININVSSASGLGEPFGQPTGDILLSAGSSIYVESVYNGYDVDVNNREIVLTDLGSGASYEMCILGQS